MLSLKCKPFSYKNNDVVECVRKFENKIRKLLINIATIVLHDSDKKGITNRTNFKFEYTRTCIRFKRQQRIFAPVYGP